MSAPKAILTVDDLSVTFRTDHGVVPALQEFSYTLNAGETLAIVGESGSGKSVGALAVMRLIPDPPGRISNGDIQFDGRSILNLSENKMQEIRGNDIAMIFQEPMTSLNPVLTVAEQIVEAVQLHQGLSKTMLAAARWRCWNWFRYPSRNNASISIRTSYPAACANES
jgi:ABC-type microcin C transport system duplicated ATPase subunit YejF